MARGQVRLLVVDDEKTVRSLLKVTLEEAGYFVTTVANGKEALGELSQNEFEAMLLDIKMPGISGMELLGKLTTERPEICIIMITGVGDTQTAVDAMKKGAYDFITKPFDRKDVVQKLRKALDKRELQLQREQLVTELQQSLKRLSEQMHEQFNELVRTLAREHTLLYDLTMKQKGSAKEALSKLPPELQKPMSSIKEYRDALLRILKRTDY